MTAHTDRDVDWFIHRFTALISHHEVEEAAVIAEQARLAGIPDAERMVGIVHWLRGDRDAARASWEAAVARGDDTALAYLAVAAHGTADSEAEVLAVSARLAEALRGPNAFEVISRIVVASSSAVDFSADPAWAADLLLDALRAGNRNALEAYLLVRGVDRDDLAGDPAADPVILGALAGVHGGMTAWYACANPSLPESATLDVIAGASESLIRALAGNDGLSPEVRGAARLRLDQLAAGDVDADQPDSIAKANDPDPAPRSLINANPGSKLSSIGGSTLVSDKTSGRDPWGDLFSGDFESVLRFGDHSNAADNPDLSDGVRWWPYAVALAWEAEQQPEPESFGARRARDFWDGIAATARPQIAVLATLAGSLVAIRHSMSDAEALLLRALELLQEEVDGVPVYATDVEPPPLPPGAAHPWVVQWYADLQAMLDWLAEVFPRRAGALALDRGDLLTAEEAFMQACRSDSPCVAGYAVNSVAFGVLIPQERYDEAELLLLANAGSPWHSEAMNSRSNLGIIAYQRGEFARARRLFTEVKQAGVAHTAPEAAYYLALLERDRGRHKSASRALAEVIAFSDSRYSGMAKIAYAELLLAQGAEEDPSDLNAAGCYLRECGRRDEARQAFLLAAAGGDPNALASLTWPLVLANAMEEAKADFEQFADAVARHTEEVPASTDLRGELRKAQANARSNAALAYLATGHEVRARQLWQLAAELGHIEARIYPAVLAWRQGDRSTAHAKLARDVDANDISTFASDMLEVLEEGTGWFRDWALDALDLIVSPPDADPLLLNNVAHGRYSSLSDRPACIEAMWKPGRSGVPPAVVTLVTGLRMAGDAVAAVDAFETCAPAMETYLSNLPEVLPSPDEEGFIPLYRGRFQVHVVDALTEAGVAHLLVGQVEAARQLWSDGRLRSHPEALLARAALSLRVGTVDEAFRLIRRILPWQRVQLESELEEWIRECSQEAERAWYVECQMALLRVPVIMRPSPNAAS